MRLNRLDLVRFGKFTDHRLCFGAAPQDGPDLHLVFGPNEAGKSTIAAAWLDFLFGVPRQTAHSFLHERKTMRITADVTLESGATELSRITTNANSLLDAAGQPVPETVIGGALGGADRNAHCAMFSLDDDTLEKGGDSILQSQGDLGQLLFSASAGLAGFSAHLDGLRKAADGFHRPGGRSGGLYEARKDLELLDARIRETDTTAAEYARLRETFEAAQQEAERTKEAYEAISTEHLLADTRLRLVPVARRFIDLRQRVSELEDLPAPPEGWIEKTADLAEKRAVLMAGARRQEEIVADLTALIAETEVDRASLDARPEMDAIASLKSAYDEAEKDLPARRQEAAETDRAIFALMARLGAEGEVPEKVLPDAHSTEQLRDLIVRRSGVVADRKAAESELAQAEAHARETAARLGASAPVGDPDAVETLADLADRLRGEDHAGACARAQSEAEAAQADLEDALAALSPWAGTAEALARLEPVSPAQTADWSRALADAEKAVSEAADDLERRSRELAEARAALAERPADNVPSLQEVASQRAERERLWALHRTDLTAATADRFEAAMRQDDLISARLAEARSSEARQSDLTGAVAAAETRCEAAGERLKTAKAAQMAAKAAYAKAVVSVDAALTGLAPEGLRLWMERRDAALTLARRLRDAEHAKALREQARAEAAEALAAALEAVGAEADGPLATLLARAATLVARHTRTAALRDQAETAAHAVARRREALSRADRIAKDWQSDWSGTCAEVFWFRKSHDFNEMRALLDVLDQLGDLTRKTRDLKSRIVKMEANRDGFLAAVTALADRLDIAPDPAPRRWAGLQARYRAAEQGAADLARHEKDHAEAVARGAGLARNLGDLEATVAEMARTYGAGDLAELREALGRATTRASLLREMEGLSDSLCASLGVSTSEEALRDLEGIDPVRLTAERDRLAMERQEHERASHMALKVLADAERAFLAIGGDDSVARCMAERQTLLLDIEEKVRQHARLRLGLIAVEDALTRYRETHRSEMMARASEAFRTISRGAYSGLAAQAEGERDVLMAIASDGASKISGALSKGTRFQLYLALRIAGYHEIASRRRPAPFIADDILETFDDDRSAETFQLLAQMAMQGQVIYFTHHAHLVEIARTVVPQVRVHRL